MKPTVVRRSTEPRAAGGSEEVNGGGVGRGELPRQNSKNTRKSLGSADVSPPLSVNATGKRERESWIFIVFSHGSCGCVSTVVSERDWYMRERVVDVFSSHE